MLESSSTTRGDHKARGWCRFVCGFSCFLADSAPCHLPHHALCARWPSAISQDDQALARTYQQPIIARDLPQLLCSDLPAIPLDYRIQHPHLEGQTNGGDL